MTALGQQNSSILVTFAVNSNVLQRKTGSITLLGHHTGNEQLLLFSVKIRFIFGLFCLEYGLDIKGGLREGITRTKGSELDSNPRQCEKPLAYMAGVLAP